jgi:hypothetical protein
MSQLEWIGSTAWPSGSIQYIPDDRDGSTNHPPLQVSNLRSPPCFSLLDFSYKWRNHLLIFIHLFILMFSWWTRNTHKVSSSLSTSLSSYTSIWVRMDSQGLTNFHLASANDEIHLGNADALDILFLLRLYLEWLFVLMNGKQTSVTGAVSIRW